MKIVALMPVKNESWVLKSSLKSLSTVVDEIIVFDDNSDENYEDIFSQLSKVKVFKGGDCDIVNMSSKRKKLLELGRVSGGTHFVWLDADELFSDVFLTNFSLYIKKMVPGQKMMMKWIFLCDKKSYRCDGVFSDLYKDFIVYDDGVAEFEDKKLSEGRTPGNNSNPIIVNPRDGVVLHLQYMNKDRNDFKQAWYRCLELIDGKRGARRINNTYAIAANSEKWRKNILPKNFESKFLDDINPETSDDNWYFKELLTFFDKYGIEFFEPLQIWDIKKLQDEFKKRVGREPLSKIFPKWLVSLNNLKNIIRALIS
jgi:glycosyltransferase involved in cell wall biosynthesis